MADSGCVALRCFGAQLLLSVLDSHQVLLDLVGFIAHVHGYRRHSHVLLLPHLYTHKFVFKRQIFVVYCSTLRAWLFFHLDFKCLAAVWIVKVTSFFEYLVETSVVVRLLDLLIHLLRFVGKLLVLEQFGIVNQGKYFVAHIE